MLVRLVFPIQYILLGKGISYGHVFSHEQQLQRNCGLFYLFHAAQFACGKKILRKVLILFDNI